MNINIQIKTNWFAATVTVDGKDIIIGMELLSTGWLVGGVFFFFFFFFCVCVCVRVCFFFFFFFFLYISYVTCE